jgi:hypothetical protein
VVKRRSPKKYLANYSVGQRPGKDLEYGLLNPETAINLDGSLPNRSSYWA